MNKKRLFLLGAAAFGVYNLYKGNGVFNKVRFSEQHDAVAKYMQTHYPGCTYSDIVKTEDGWSCVINTYRKSTVLYMTKTPDGKFVFWETEV